MEVVIGTVIVFVLGAVAGWHLKIMLDDIKSNCDLEDRINSREDLFQ